MKLHLQFFGGRGGGSGMTRSSGSSSQEVVSSRSTSAFADSDNPYINGDIPMNRRQIQGYFDLIGFDYNRGGTSSISVLDVAVGATKNRLDTFPDVKRARIQAEKLPKTGDPIMDKPSNVKDYWMATMAGGESRAEMNKYWSTTPGKVDLARFMKGEIEAGLTGSEMKEVIDSAKKRRR